MNKTYSDIGWLITACHTGNPERVGSGQGMREANETAANYEEGIRDEDGSLVVPVRQHMVESEIPADKRIRWRSFDEHGYPIYDGIAHIAWLYPDADGNGFEYDHPGYNIDRWNRESIGALVVIYNAADICRACTGLSGHVAAHKRITNADFIANGGFDPADWLELYA